MNTNAAVRGFVAFRFAVCRSAPGRLFGSRDAAKGQAECCSWGVCCWEAFWGVCCPLTPDPSPPFRGRGEDFVF